MYTQNEATKNYGSSEAQISLEIIIRIQMREVYLYKELWKDTNVQASSKNRFA